MQLHSVSSMVNSLFRFLSFIKSQRLLHKKTFRTFRLTSYSSVSRYDTTDSVAQTWVFQICGWFFACLVRLFRDKTIFLSRPNQISSRCLQPKRYNFNFFTSNLHIRMVKCSPKEQRKNELISRLPRASFVSRTWGMESVKNLDVLT